ncbi:type VI secretion system Vgr family protein [Paracoccus sulfuroxidans]|uniref:Type VI secretion system secreted protein VgrG n=1 Tax=Paracoccus sulfuroxidans TaxID=384678 RepID=A0A562NNX5_9RHOB|nr:type VI secretion system tip protein TssI/VgrG [Paracoccus sulfuroxidans]TWI33878.1 type VI secretion system secreted protein VgrG [Paracoccus sulfuroxidans]
MTAPLRQTDRLGRLTTELGEDTIVLLRFEGTDFVNDLYEYRVEGLAARNDLDFDALIGTHATVEVATRSGTRSFDGIVASARWAGIGESGHRYDLTLRPWFWLTGLRRNQRIFHNKTVVEIVREVLADYSSLGDPAFEIELSNEYPVLEYTVQYRESDLDFLRRQLERHGISFYFRHAMGSHTLVMTDDVLAHDSIGERPFKSYDGHHQSEQEHFWEWAPERNLTTGAIRLTDYDFKRPPQAMEVVQTGDAAYAQGQIESFDYPGGYTQQADGKMLGRLRTDQERGGDRRNRAIGDCASLGSGMRVQLGGDSIPGTGETFLCLAATHSLISEAYASGGQGSDGYSFTGSYVLMPDTAPMVPPRRTPQPVVHGPQTAKVVGSGEIDCDEFGRILVRFHWDLDEAYSMRCRVSQNWAGSGWGGMVIPRNGMEVVVEFLEGDPDKPLVTGCVYNGANMPPMALPEHKTRSTFKTSSVSAEGFNELTFEDKGGEEFIYLHAQKNLDMKVLNSAQRRVDYDDTVSIGNDSKLIVAANRTESIEGLLDLSVKGEMKEKIDGDRGVTVGGTYANRAGGDLTLKAEGEIVIDAAKITLVAGGAALVLEGGAVNVAPILNVGSASPGAAALPAIPAVLKAAAAAGSPFVSHCPLAKAEA